jgi:pimeloyl-ACP methyl ester carboxylesterase
MAKVKVNGIEIDYQVSGRGRPVILSHGYGATRRMWDGQHAALGDRYRLITWDMRGHGQTVADTRALLQALGVSRAVVGGLSLGGYMSLAFYLTHPEMVEALVICDSGPGYRNAEARAAWNERAHQRAANLEARGLDAFAGRSREVREALAHHRSAQGLAHAARGMLAQADSRVIDGLASIRVPTLIVVGDRDEPFLAPCQYMAKKIPGARLEMIAGAGHSSNLDEPAAFDRILLDFLDSLPPERR